MAKNIVTVYRATRHGETCHFGVASAAKAWAGQSGSVEEIQINGRPTLSVVEGHAPFDECGPDCTTCGMLCRLGTDIDERYASRLALMLECLIVDYHGHWNEACALLDEYKAEWEKVNPSPPTFMGEPMPPERKERLMNMQKDRAENAAKLRADYSDCHGPDWTDRDSEYLK